MAVGYKDIIVILNYFSGDDMSALVNALLKGQLSKHKNTIYMEDSPQTIAQNQKIGHIAISDWNNSVSVVLPSGQIFNFGSSHTLAWLFYVKSHFVLNTTYKTTGQETIAVFLERLLQVPGKLCSKATPGQRRQLELLS